VGHAFYLQTTPVTKASTPASLRRRLPHRAERGDSGGSGWNGSELVQKKEYTWKTPGFAQTDDHPVVLVTYADAVSFTSWASAKSGRTIRLPTEAEYELAARAGTTTACTAATPRPRPRKSAGSRATPETAPAPSA